MSGLRYVLAICSLALLMALYLGSDEALSPAPNAGLEHSRVAPVQ